MDKDKVKDVFGKINKAIDAISDIIVEDVSSINEVHIFTYRDLQRYVKERIKADESIKKFTISVVKSARFEAKIFASEKFVIRIVMLQEDKSPVFIDGNPNEYVGTIIIADEIDSELNTKMDGKDTKTFKCGRGNS